MNLEPGAARGIGQGFAPSLGPGEIDSEDLFDGDDIAPWRREVYDPNDYESKQEIPDPDGWSFPDE
jgi:hypothetical protein